MKIISRERITDITEYREGTNELVHRLIVERVTFDEAGEVPESPDIDFFADSFRGCDVRCEHCKNREICYFADEGLVTLTPTKDPLTWVMTAEYRE